MLPHWLRPSRRPTSARPAKRPLAPRWQPGLVQLEDRLAPATKLFAGLEFVADSFTAGPAVTSTVPVQVGKDPGAGTFRPLLQLTNGVSFTEGDATGTFTTSGAVKTAISGSGGVQLLDPGESHMLTAPALLGGGLSVPAGESDSSGFTVAGMTFKLGSAKFADNAVTLQGSVAVPQLAGLTFAVAGTDTVSIGTGGVSLTGLDVTTTSPMTFSRSGISFTTGSLTAHYSSAPNRFELTGTASLSVANNTVGLNLGTAAAPGLVIAGGDLASLDATVTTPSFSVGGLTLTLSSAKVQFDAANNRFAIAGGAAFTLGGSSVNLALTGDGLVFKDNAVSSLDATVNGSVPVGGLAFTATDLKLAYRGGATNLVGVSGKASIAVGSSNSVAVTLGTAASPGLTLLDGAVSSLNATVTANITAGELTFTAQGMQVEYRPTTSDIRIKGTSSVALPGGTPNATVTFGNGGLVLKSGVLDSLDAAVSGNLKAGGLAVTFDTLNLTYAKATSTYTLSGAATFSLGTNNPVAIQLGSPAIAGRPATAGIVLTGGTLTTLDAAVTGQVKAGVTLEADRLRVQYAAPSTVRVTGKSTFKLGTDAVSVDLGSTGLLISGGSLVSLDATVDGAVKAGGLSFTPSNLALSYLASGTNVKVTGGASFALGTNTVGVDLTGNGLQIAGGTLTSLDATVKSNIAVGGLTFTSSGLSLAYRSDKSDIRIGGSSSVTLPGGSSATVTFADPDGLVIQDGSLKSLDAKVSGNLSAGGLGVTLSGVTLTYSAANTSYSLKGGASFTLPGQSAPVVITLGSGTTNGIVLQNGAVNELNASVSTDLTFGGLTFSAAGMAVEYRALGNDIRIGGTSSVTLPGGTATVRFLDTGIVIKSGSLDSLDATLDGKVKAGGLEVSLAGVNLKYAANSLSLKGEAKIQAAGRDVSLKLGSDTTPGLVIVNGAVTTLNAAVSGKLTFGGLDISADALGIQYAATDGTRVAITGSASLTVPGGSRVGLQLGTTAHPGLVFVNGTLTDLNLGVTADFDLKGLKVGVRELTVGYTPATNGMAERLSIDGALFLSTGGSTPLIDHLSAVLGSTARNGTYTHGLLVEGGVLKQFDISISGGFNLYGVSVTANSLHVTYDADAQLVRLTGGAAAKLASISASVNFPAAVVGSDNKATGGLTINTGTGEVTLDGLDLALNAKVGSFGASLKVSYGTANGLVTVSGSGSVTIPGLGPVGASFVVIGGQLDQISIFSNIPIQVGTTPFQVTHIGAKLINLSHPEDVQFSGEVDVTLGRSIMIGGSSYNILTARGSLTVDANHLVIGGDIWLLAHTTGTNDSGLPIYSGLLGDGHATVNLNFASGVYSALVDVSLLHTFFFHGSLTATDAGEITVLATAKIVVPAELPLIGGREIGSGGFYLQIRPAPAPASQTFAAGWVNVLGSTFGVKYSPGSAARLIGKGEIAGLQDAPSQPGQEHVTGLPYSWLYKETFEVPWDGVDAQVITVTAPAFSKEVPSYGNGNTIYLQAIGTDGYALPVGRISLQTVPEWSGQHPLVVVAGVLAPPVRVSHPPRARVVGGGRAGECAAILGRFFQAKRALGKK